MLVQVSESGRWLGNLAESPAHSYVFRNYCECRHENTEIGVVLGNRAQNPDILIAHYKGSLMAVGDPGFFKAAADDLFHHRVEQNPPWSIEEMRDSTLEEQENPGLFCNSTPLAFWEALARAGFDVDPKDTTVAYAWYTTGEPRFAAEVKHPCRLGRGEELHGYVRRGISYDPEGHYTRACLNHGPSFVCEVDGEAVCWSATHLSGSMAMIYTPEEHRRKGYARSLAAFQIDYMLERHGLACCHIISTNDASNALIQEFGFVRAGSPLVWRNVRWPAVGASQPGRED